MGNRRSIEVHPIDGEIRRTDILAKDDSSDEFDEGVIRSLWRFLGGAIILLVIAVTWTVLS